MFQSWPISLPDALLKFSLPYSFAYQCKISHDFCAAACPSVAYWIRSNYSIPNTLIWWPFRGRHPRYVPIVRIATVGSISYGGREKPNNGWLGSSGLDNILTLWSITSIKSKFAWREWPVSHHQDWAVLSPDIFQLNLVCFYSNCSSWLISKQSTF